MLKSWHTYIFMTKTFIHVKKENKAKHLTVHVQTNHMCLYKYCMTSALLIYTSTQSLYGTDEGMIASRTKHYSCYIQ